MNEDVSLRKHVMDELDFDAQVDATHVAVTAAGGVVTLTGHVPSYPETFSACKAVRRVGGVRAVVCEINVRLPSSANREDQDIAESIVRVLEHDIHLPDNDIKAEVADGLIILDGEVNWEYQRRHIEKQVAHVSGVRKIVNQIKLKIRVMPADVKEQIEQALARNAQLEASRVSVEVKGDEVILSGNVKAFYERNLIEAAAWSAPGVHKVSDHITVGLRD